MRILSLALLGVALAVIATPVSAQQPPIKLPNDGNGLLEFCSHVVNTLDSPSSEISPDLKTLEDNLTKFAWCLGYIQATDILIFELRTELMVGASTGVVKLQVSGSDLEQALWIPKLLKTCVPANAPDVQLARVIVKYLRDNPKRLHEPPIILTVAALHDAFPCQVPATTQEPSTR